MLKLIGIIILMVIVVRVIRFATMLWLGGKTFQQHVKEKMHPSNATLELMACPYCGVFTSPPCTNPECPGRR